MPELPEVETVKEAVRVKAEGRIIERVDVRRRRIRIEIPADFELLVTGRKVTKVRRIAKYILMDLDNKESVVIHLGMSGVVTITDDVKVKKHDHVIFSFSPDFHLIYNDARRFGLVTLLKHLDLSGLGVDALSKNFTGHYLYESLKKRKSSVKQALLDQEMVAGLGNIYVVEALFLSGISPLRKAGSVNEKECGVLVKNIKSVLRKAVVAGGTTLKDYRRVDGSLGYFKNRLHVYGREKEACPECGHPIKRVIQGGRSTFYCTNCQV